MVRKNPVQMHTKPNIGGKGGETFGSFTCLSDVPFFFFCKGTNNLLTKQKIKWWALKNCNSSCLPFQLNSPSTLVFTPLSKITQLLSLWKARRGKGVAYKVFLLLEENRLQAPFFFFFFFQLHSRGLPRVRGAQKADAGARRNPVPVLPSPALAKGAFNSLLSPLLCPILSLSEKRGRS